MHLIRSHLQLGLHFIHLVLNVIGTWLLSLEPRILKNFLHWCGSVRRVRVEHGLNKGSKVLRHLDLDISFNNAPVHWPIVLLNKLVLPVLLSRSFERLTLRRHREKDHPSSENVTVYRKTLLRHIKHLWWLVAFGSHFPFYRLTSFKAVQVHRYSEIDNF